LDREFTEVACDAETGAPRVSFSRRCGKECSTQCGCTTKRGSTCITYDARDVQRDAVDTADPDCECPSRCVPLGTPRVCGCVSHSMRVTGLESECTHCLASKW
jgi:hypothetical protein